MGGYLLRGASVLAVDPQDTHWPAADIRIDGKQIVEIAPTGLPRRDGEIELDCRETLITPGLVNTHTHAATALYRGLADDLSRDFWAGSYAVPGQDRFSLQDQVLSARAACLEFLLHGVTCIADRFADMDVVGPAIAASGIRAALGNSISDARGPADWGPTERLIERWGTDPAQRVFAGLAPHALDTCSDRLLRETADRQQKHGGRVFVHVAQSAPEVAALRARGHAGALACLKATGLAIPELVAAHAIYLDQEEIEEWPRHGMAIAHCPASNLKIEARTLPLHRLIEHCPIGLGTDWTATNNSMDLLLEARIAALAGKMLACDPTCLTVPQMLRMLTIEGARALGLERLIGSIEIGKHADLVIWDLNRLEATPCHDPASNLIYSMSPRCVRDVFVDGANVVRDGKGVIDAEPDLARRNRALARLDRGT